MRTGVKTLLAILSTLALLAGCKSKPKKPAFLHANTDAVQFVEWTQEGMRIKEDI